MMHPAALVGAGFLLGTIGMKAITSAPVKKAAVKGIACGMKTKECVQAMIDEAKAEVDDLIAEASYEVAEAKAECEAEEAAEEAKAE